MMIAWVRSLRQSAGTRSEQRPMIWQRARRLPWPWGTRPRSGAVVHDDKRDPLSLGGERLKQEICTVREPAPCGITNV